MPSFENIRVKDPNFTFDGLYFYTVDNDTDTLIQKTDDGTIAFSYPLNRDVGTDVKALHYDGAYKPSSLDGMSFWTLEDKATSDGIIIRKFTISNFVASEATFIQLDDVPAFGGPIGDIWDVNDIAIETYNTEVVDFGVGTNDSTAATLYVNDNLTGDTFGSDGSNGTGQFTEPGGVVPGLSDNPDPNSTKSQKDLLREFKYDDDSEILTSGMTITIGPNELGETVTKTVNGNPTHLTNPVQAPQYNVLQIPIAGTLGVDFDNTGDSDYPFPVRFTKNIFIFNNNNRAAIGGGAIYIYNQNGSEVKYSPAQEFDSVQGSVFSQRDRRVVVVKATNSLYVEPNVNDIKITKSAVLDNVEPDNVTVIPVFDLAAAFTGTLFRLQSKQTFDGVLESWSTNNYVLTPLFPLVTSISIRPVPQIIAADGADRSRITITVRDQFNNPAPVGLDIVVTEDNANGSLFTGPTFSSEFDGTVTLQIGVNGQVELEYEAGTDNTLVTIGATVQQLAGP